MRSDIARVQAILDPKAPAPIEGLPVTTVATLEARIHAAHSELADVSRRCGDALEALREARVMAGDLDDRIAVLKVELEAAKELVAGSNR